MSNRKELTALKNLISETDQILATTPELPENRTARCHISDTTGLIRFFKASSQPCYNNDVV